MLRAKMANVPISNSLRRQIRKDAAGLQMMDVDRRFLPAAKSGGYGFPARQRVPWQSSGVWISERGLRTFYPTRNIKGWGAPRRQPSAKDKLVRLVAKKSRKTGAFYYQRMQTNVPSSMIPSMEGTKRYVKGVDFGYSR
jgi:hypothetical protein